MHSIVCVYAAPIPVGHRIDCQWFSLAVEGIFSGSQMYPYPHEPLIKDLDTGIEYCSERGFQRSAAKMPDRPIEVTDQPLTGAQVTHRIIGRVTRCRVVTLRGYSEVDLQTHIDIEPEPPPT